MVAGHVLHLPRGRVFRIAGHIQVNKGKWYYGFTCKNCGNIIYSISDPADGQNLVKFEGEGQFSVPCHACNTDELIYDSFEILLIQAAADGPSSPGLSRRKPSNKPKQLVKTRYPTAKPTFGPKFIEERPESAIIIARCVTLWSYIEHSLALLLSSVLRINTKPAVAMFLAINSSRTQLDVLTAAAEAQLSERDFELFTALIRLRGSIEKERNSLVHGLVGGSMIVKDGILVVEQKRLTEHTARVWYEGMDPLESDTLRSHTFVYEPEDLETIAQNMEWLHQFIGVFRFYISSTDIQWRSVRYKQLCADSRISKELAALRASRKKSR